MIKLYRFDELRPEEILNRDIRAEKDVGDGILADVRARGDAALKEYALKFDGASIEELQVTQAEIDEAFANMDPYFLETLKEAAANIEAFHRQQVHKNFVMNDKPGVVLGQKYTPIEKAGVYVPGGKAVYPSSVLMNAMPAHVAGCKKIVMVVPTPGGKPNQLVLAAACLAGVKECYTIGGAQAIAALAYGTETIPAVDKIVGPGNAYVAAAKRYVFGTVGIDMIAGPSEILVICDGKTNPDWIAMDLFSQAEHDELAQAILLTDDAEFADKVAESIDRQIKGMSRKDIISASLNNRGAIIVTRSIEEACKVADTIAPEHLELSVQDADKYIDQIHHAGALFVGPYTCEALGDYCAGPNHVLPTSRTARYSSPLGVWDFQKRMSVLKVSKHGAEKLGRIADVLARGESPLDLRFARVGQSEQPHDLHFGIVENNLFVIHNLRPGGQFARQVPRFGADVADVRNVPPAAFLHLVEVETSHSAEADKANFYRIHRVVNKVG